MKLKELLQNIDYKLLSGNINVSIKNIAYDSRKVKKSDLFVALVGYNVDGHNYISDAIGKGAKVIVVDRFVEIDQNNVTIIRVADTRKALAVLSSNYFANPLSKLKVIGITGTKGKTTTTFMIKRILELSKYKVGVMGTNGVFYKDVYHPLNNTTPESYEIYKYFKEMVDNKIKYVVMEVSSQALKYDRCYNIKFEYGVFTNLTHDHISDFEHPTMEDYINSKALLFKKCKHGVFNMDDDHFNDMIKDATCDIHTFGCNKKADLYINKIDFMRESGSIGIKVKFKNAINDVVYINTPGKFSSYNAACAILVCHLIGCDIEVIKKAMKDFHVKGRAEPVNVKDHVTFIIDYAHNGVSMESILTTMRQYRPKRLITIFGCGGNRSRDRRYEMGEVSGNMADFSIITSDNPRFEEPQAIIDDILVGINKTKGEYITIIDRKEAIKYAIENAKRGDIILLLGKGHEDYQEIKGVKYHFDDREIVEEIVKENSTV